MAVNIKKSKNLECYMFIGKKNYKKSKLWNVYYLSVSIKDKKIKNFIKEIQCLEGCLLDYDTDK